jgi:glycosyltransferase involved in cell wall biosynthesis
MTACFPNKETVVLNAFADLGYTKHVDFEIRDGISFLYSGTLDSIRGVELIPDLVMSLRQRVRHFSIIITGKGPLETMVKSWRHPEIQYRGFLDPEAYAETIQQVDACLILQKPDHPFNSGSFPSKVEEYATFRKPIYILREQEQVPPPDGPGKSGAALQAPRGT